VKGFAHNALVELFRQLVVVQGAVERAESAYTGPNFSTVVAALDEANDQLLIAVNAS